MRRKSIEWVVMCVKENNEVKVIGIPGYVQQRRYDECDC